MSIFQKTILGVQRFLGLAGGQGATDSAAFTLCAIVLGAKLAKVDGRVTEEEILAFHEAFQVPPGELDHVRSVFDRARRDSDGFAPYAAEMADMLGDDPAQLEAVLDALFHIAKADAVVNEVEIDYLAAVAGIFGLSQDDFARVRAGHLGADRNDPYHVLGIDRGMPPDKIKLAYRRLVREHHPDRLIAKGMPEDFIRRATSRLAQINGAYARIAAERGF